VSSSVAALIEMRKIEEDPTRTVLNEESNRHCAVLVAIDSGEKESAA